MTAAITVLGMVQGVGFRPYVAQLAEELHLTGTVRNSGGIVKIIATGEKKAVDELICRLSSHPPKGAQIVQVLSERLEDQTFERFTIVPSDPQDHTLPLIPPDLPLCSDCLKELRDPNNRRYGYPFISCVACGPRYSIIDSIPYDRDTTTMVDFAMCPSCQEEYTSAGRRRHAQTISCHDCGPQLLLFHQGQVLQKQAALEKAVELLKKGGILAVKGIGGYQFVCTPYGEQTVCKLRKLKHRYQKPFAIMFPDMESIQQCCQVSGQEQQLLCSTPYPIVLLSKTQECFAPNVSSESRKLGVFLPYTPLHQLLTDECGPLIATSGNLSSEPIITQDEQMFARDFPQLDGVLYNKRRIVAPLDDSVGRVICGESQVLRRSRGYVPAPILLDRASPKPLLAMGGDLKACFGLIQDRSVYLSQYLGDMEEYQIHQLYQETLERMERLFSIHPAGIACDLHPGYLTTQLAHKLAELRDLPVLPIQHHHAHAASILAEHHLDGCIGVVFDGTGYGTDHTIWGGEFLLCRGNTYQRLASLDPIPMAGGDQSAKDASLSALCHQIACGLGSEDSRFPLISAALKQQVHTTLSTSMGRLFDAVSALLGLGQYNSYEGACAIALENAAIDGISHGEAPHPLHFDLYQKEGRWIMGRKQLIRDIVGARDHVSVESLALGFHQAVAQAVLQVCIELRDQTGENRVGLSGGVFANQLLTERCYSLLQENHFRVYLNRAIPCNDSGICLGQAYIASMTS